MAAAAALAHAAESTAVEAQASGTNASPALISRTDASSLSPESISSFRSKSDPVEGDTQPSAIPSESFWAAAMRSKSLSERKAASTISNASLRRLESLTPCSHSKASAAVLFREGWTVVSSASSAVGSASFSSALMGTCSAASLDAFSGVTSLSPAANFTIGCFPVARLEIRVGVLLNCSALPRPFLPPHLAVGAAPLLPLLGALPRPPRPLPAFPAGA